MCSSSWSFRAGNFIVVKGAIGILPPIGFTFLRYSIATITLLILLRWREGAIRLPRGDVVPILVLGVIGFGCYQILWPVALQTIPAGDSALLIAATPVMTALLHRDGGRCRHAERGQAHRCIRVVRRRGSGHRRRPGCQSHDVACR